eukprot:TRINITY_DN6313_c0_g1_i1.p1 TRINITY_DN6313_c0_g1~~TRINITY_DN6313_c0_g1_i1.p1  ORF type:complete len:182 (-),score=84.46 TRINITY_DN6313_c0_g1_i1:91-585(-)
MFTDREKELVGGSWAIVSKPVNDDDKPLDELAKIFYGRLWGDYPEVIPLFKIKDMKVQGRKLTSIINKIVTTIDHFGDAEARAVTALGARHYHYKVKDEHYGYVAKSLLYALSTQVNARGGKWDDETEAAWTNVYTFLATAMIKATHDKELHEKAKQEIDSGSV